MLGFELDSMAIRKDQLTVRYFGHIEYKEVREASVIKRGCPRMM